MTPTTNSEWFTQTSDKPYDRHYYTIKDKRFDDFELMRNHWWNSIITDQVVIVHDYKKKKKRGFA